MIREDLVEEFITALLTYVNAGPAWDSADVCEQGELVESIRIQMTRDEQRAAMERVERTRL